MAPALGFNTTAPADREALPPEAVFEAALRNYHICGTAYPLRHHQTLRPYRLADAAAESFLPRAWTELSSLGLYVHIPFCERRCAYCEYAVVESQDAAGFDAYIDLLERELALYQALIGLRGRALAGFDIGGGTPMLLDGRQMARVVELAGRHFGSLDGITISTETTPALAAAHPERLADYHGIGLRRISMGVQTTDSRLLDRLGRRDDARLHGRAMDNLRKAGFSKVNLDLIYGIEGQTEASWMETLHGTVAMQPEYITLYRLRHKGTRLQGRAAQVPFEQIVRLAQMAESFLASTGYHAPCGKNTFSRISGDGGVSDYLTARVAKGLPYLGIGLGAQSWTGRSLSYNQGAADKQLRAYADKLLSNRPPLQDLYHLAEPAAWAKMIAVSFYFGAIEREPFRARFGRDLDAAFGRQISWLAARGYVDDGREAVRLTPDGFAVLPGVVAQFYQPAVQRYLIETDWNAQVARAPKAARSTGRTSRPERPAYDFANILFSGPCNQRCRWCLGRSLPSRCNGDTLDAWPLPGIDPFIERINACRIPNVVLTGTDTDPQLYRHEARLLDLLRARLHPGAAIQLHTNGQLALQKIALLNRYDRICLSFPSFDPDTCAAITGVAAPPPLAEIVRRVRVPVKVSCVVDRHNAPEVDAFIAGCRAAGVKRLSFRKLHDTEGDLVDLSHLPLVGEYGGNPIYDGDGISVAYWDFARANLRSLNLFHDGTIGESYLLARS